MSETIEGTTFDSLLDTMKGYGKTAWKYGKKAGSWTYGKGSGMYEDWKYRYSSNYRVPKGVRYREAPWYMQYIDTMAQQQKPKKTNALPWLFGLAGVGVAAYFLFFRNKDTTTTTDPTSGGGISETVIGTDDTSDIPLIPDYLTQETQTPNTGYTTPITYPSFVPTGKQDGTPTEYTTPEQYRQQLVQTYADAGITIGAPIQVADADTSFVPYVSREAKAQAEAPKSNAVAALEQAISGKTQTYTKEQTAAAMQTMMQNAPAPAYSGYIAPSNSGSTFSGIASTQNTYNAQKSALESVNAAKQSKQTNTAQTVSTPKKSTPTFSGIASTQNTYNAQKSALASVNSAKQSKQTNTQTSTAKTNTTSKTSTPQKSTTTAKTTATQPGWKSIVSFFTGK